MTATLAAGLRVHPARPIQTAHGSISGALPRRMTQKVCDACLPSHRSGHDGCTPSPSLACSLQVMSSLRHLVPLQHVGVLAGSHGCCFGLISSSCFLFTDSPCSARSSPLRCLWRDGTSSLHLAFSRHWWPWWDYLPVHCDSSRRVWRCLRVSGSVATAGFCETRGCLRVDN